jgi:hypothetical protein
MQQPLGCLAGAAASGSRRKLQAAIKALPQGQLLRCCSALATAAQSTSQAGARAAGCVHQAGSGSSDTVAAVMAAQQAAVAHLQAAVASKGSGRGQEVPVAAAVLEGAVWGAMTSFQQWRLGLLVMSLVARFTGVPVTVHTAPALPACFAL